MKKRLHVYFSGSVHGVGFRFTVERLAANLGLKGWVRNLPDSRVEVLCEGKEDDLTSLLNKLNEIFRPYIRDVDEEWAEATGEFETFEVRF